MASLSQVHDPMQEPGRDAALERHLRRLALHAVPWRGHVGFPGDQGLRLSMDLATGSAGILLMLHAVLDGGTALLPFLGATKGGSDAHPRRPMERTGYNRHFPSTFKA